MGYLRQGEGGNPPRAALTGGQQKGGGEKKRERGERKRVKKLDGWCANRVQQRG